MWNESLSENLETFLKLLFKDKKKIVDKNKFNSYLKYHEDFQGIIGEHSYNIINDKISGIINQESPISFNPYLIFFWLQSDLLEFYGERIDRKIKKELIQYVDSVGLDLSTVEYFMKSIQVLEKIEFDIFLLELQKSLYENNEDFEIVTRSYFTISGVNLYSYPDQDEEGYFNKLKETINYIFPEFLNKVRLISSINKSSESYITWLYLNAIEFDLVEEKDLELLMQKGIDSLDIRHIYALKKRESEKIEIFFENAIMNLKNKELKNFLMRTYINYMQEEKYIKNEYIVGWIWGNYEHSLSCDDFTNKSFFIDSLSHCIINWDIFLEPIIKQIKIADNNEARKWNEFILNIKYDSSQTSITNFLYKILKCEDAWANMYKKSALKKLGEIVNVTEKNSIDRLKLNLPLRTH